MIFTMSREGLAIKNDGGVIEKEMWHEIPNTK
jgi:hypothetical protein